MKITQLALRLAGLSQRPLIIALCFSPFSDLGATNASLAQVIQQQPAGRLAFATIYVKPHKYGYNDAGIVSVSSAEIRMTGVTAEQIIRFAYGWKDRISGGPPWYDKLLFDVVGTAGSSASRDQLTLMARTFLEEGFHFSCHLEGRNTPAYRLTIGKKPRFEATQAEKSEGIRVTGAHDNNEPNHRFIELVYTATGVSMEEFAEWLSRELVLPVLDDTATVGRFDFTFALENTPEQAIGWQTFSQKLRAPAEYVANIENQVGVRLTKDQAYLETLFIDSLEKLKVK